jgi:hypothetical protein
MDAKTDSQAAKKRIIQDTIDQGKAEEEIIE